MPWRQWSRGWRRGSPGWRGADPAATVGGEGTGTLRAGNGLGTGERRGGGEEALAELPVGLALPEIGSGLWEGFLAAVNLGSRAPAPSRS